MPEDLPSLSALVEHVRRELETIDLQRQAAGKVALFSLSSLELELHFTVTHNDTKKGGIDLKIVSAGLETAHKAEQVHKIKILYTAVAENARGAPLGSRAEFPDVTDISPLR
jgi:hypothetical protein